jgi:serine/threonine protein kinase
MPTRSPADPFIGKTIAGRYKVERLLGQGGMGAIYSATQEPLGRKIALKVLLQAYAKDATAVARFEKEARSISKLVHPNIVTIFDFGQTEDGDFFIAMELLDGHSIRETLDQNGRLDSRRALHIVQGIAIGLSEAHRRNIIHRDLKPENVMLVRSGEDHQFPKILDFGLARTNDPGEDETQLTQKDMIPGTPSYISPERINGVGNDPRSDLYSLGALWFELIAGRPPFLGETPVKVIVAHVQEPVPSFHSLNPPVNAPEEIELIIRKLLSKDPEDRPRSATQLLRSMQDLVTPESWSASSPGEIGQHRHDALSDWAEEVEREIPNLDFADFFGLEDDNDEKLDFTGEDGTDGFGNDPFGEISLETEAVEPTDTFVLLTDPKAETISLVSRKSPVGASSPYWSKIAETLPTPPSLSEAQNQLLNAGTGKEIAEILSNYLGNFFDRTLVLDIQNRRQLEVIASRAAKHLNEVQELFDAADGFWSLLLEGTPYYGPAPQENHWPDFYTHISSYETNGIFVAMLKKNGENWGAVYAEHSATSLHQDLSDVAHLLNSATERLQKV